VTGHEETYSARWEGASQKEKGPSFHGEKVHTIRKGPIGKSMLKGRLSILKVRPGLFWGRKMSCRRVRQTESSEGFPTAARERKRFFREVVIRHRAEMRKEEKREKKRNTLTLSPGTEKFLFQGGKKTPHPEREGCR